MNALTISLFMKRIFVNNTHYNHDKDVPKMNTLYMFSGGPGLSDAGNESPAVELIRNFLFDNYTIYLIDHRGTGKSSTFDCKQVEGYGLEQLIKCNEELISVYGANYIKAFTVTNAALDIVYTVNEVNADMVKNQCDRLNIATNIRTSVNRFGIFNFNCDCDLIEIPLPAVFGASYGTYLLNRYLTLLNFEKYNSSRELRSSRLTGRTTPSKWVSTSNTW